MPTNQLAQLMDEFEVTKGAEEVQSRRLVFSALRTELSRCYDDEVKAMDSAALVEALDCRPAHAEERVRGCAVRPLRVPP